MGTFGDITFQALGDERVRARVRYRDQDGQLRPVQATGDSRKSADGELKVKLAKRRPRGDQVGELTADSPFPKLAAGGSTWSAHRAA